MKTRAAVLYDFDKPLRVEELELDEPKANEVLVRMMANGICGSDLHAIKAELPVSLPMALGHEGAGIVEKVGSAVTKVKPGDHVITVYNPFCNACEYCLTGTPYLCANWSAGTLEGILPGGDFRMRNANGDGIRQWCYLGTLSEHAVLSEMSVIKVDDDLPFAPISLVACGGATGFGAPFNRAKVQPGQSVLVLGCGGVGSFALQGARVAGATTIIAADRNDFKLEQAKLHFGATHTINTEREDVVQRCKELTRDGQGVNHAFEVISTPETIGQAIEATAKAGTTTIIGMMQMDHVGVPMNPTMFVALHKTLYGSLYGASIPQADFARYFDMYRSGQLKLDEAITREYTLDQVNDAFADVVNGTNLRGVVRFD
ncbi:S-(hydroxymethyl)glutathione dehydrogenase / alcohol dehydrogenase [Jatrophihabitans endophyticus]|uniref:S-(Hydroxymethyl)glutathione dehydrogenase / alcohol dehydrogenase n=1 Tax=Jatrophihabitans endophyticus TaxID=1206085 RepID=A0A1M5PYT8_9ACTN|nr:Zn-dependent alcohol dehydrogenase [Jatrophihabitans endophyticus]SHH06816.1 S-(hydroxymethyl)glutathione dehydrogenase / alcohol dehydrogenase [Jatrophihabitans endophyticus]